MTQPEDDETAVSASDRRGRRGCGHLSRHEHAGHAGSGDGPCGRTRFAVRGSGYGKRVVILGAGISGMTAAYELSRAGYHCTILEATNRAGGRNLTVRGGDVIREVDSRQWVDFDGEDHLYANLGPARIPHHHRAILDYCKEFGVELEVFTNDNRGGGSFTTWIISTARPWRLGEFQPICAGTSPSCSPRR